MKVDILWILKLVFLRPHQELVSLLGDLETNSNVFMASSCLVQPALSFRPGEKKTCFAASASGLWFILTQRWRTGILLSPSCLYHSLLGAEATLWVFVLIKSCWPLNLFAHAPSVTVYKGLYKDTVKSGSANVHSENNSRSDLTWTWGESKT